MLAIRHTDLESEFTIGSAQTVAAGPSFDGKPPIRCNRMNFRRGTVGTLQISPGSQMWQVLGERDHDEAPSP